MERTENGTIQEESDKTTLVPYNTQQIKLRPKYYKHLIEILTTYSDPIFNYLSLPELSNTRGVNKMFQMIIHEYFQKRLKMEIQAITSYQAMNQEKSSYFMKNIDSQIPISNNNWLNFDLQSVKNQIQSLSRDTITQLRAIKNLGKFSENIYAPFCIIFGFNKSKDAKVRSDGWKKTAGKIIHDSNFFIKAAKLDLENFNDSDMLEAFVSLNLPELDVALIKRYSPALSELVSWCQAVVSYHILIHPYVYRNDKSQIEAGGEVYEFAQNMNYMINKFYKFKRFLYNLGLIKIPLGDYVFNLQHSREYLPASPDFKEALTASTIGNIFSYIPIKDAFKLMNVNCCFFYGFKNSLEKISMEILKEIYYFKAQCFEALINKLPLLYESNIFSKYFIMLDDILNSESSISEKGNNYITFMTKEHLNDLKCLKIDNELTNTICKVACIILKQKVERKINAKGEFKYLYMNKIKQLALNASLAKMMRQIDKLDLNKNQCKVLSESMYKFYSSDKVEEVKNINRGLYQLLLWELYIFEYIKEYNPFTLVNIDVLINLYKLDSDEIDMIKYYNKLLCFLKYNLKAKFHFGGVVLDGPSRCFNYDFKKILNILRDYLAEKMALNENIFDTKLAEHAKIASVYFESKDLIPYAAKPALYERIMIEIISTSGNSQCVTRSNEYNSTDYDNKQNQNNLDIIKEEYNVDTNNSTNFKAQMMQNSMASPSNFQSKPSNLISDQCNTNIYEDSYITRHFDMINDDIIIQLILFYLDIKSLPNFSMVNKKCNRCVKTHMFIRLYYLNKEKEMIEQEHKDIVSGIYNKRNKFYADFEMAPPSKAHAYKLMKKVTRQDILELKQLYKKYNKVYESIIAPLVILFGEKPKCKYKFDGTKEVSYFEPAQKILYQRNFYKLIQNLSLDTISAENFYAAEKLLQEPNFSGSRVSALSPSLIHIVSWIMGVIEYHRTARMYSLSYYDYDILDQKEIEFCEQMDGISLLYYNLQKFALKYCKKYEDNALSLMQNMA